MRKSLFLIVFILNSYIYLNAQPYLDLLNIQNTTGPNFNFFNNTNRLVHFNTSLNLPIKLNKEGSKLLLFSPFFEKWDVNTISNTSNIFKNATNRFQLNSLRLPIGIFSSMPLHARTSPHGSRKNPSLPISQGNSRELPFI